MFRKKSEGEKALDEQLDRIVSAAYEEAAAELEATANEIEMQARATKVKKAKSFPDKVRDAFGLPKPPAAGGGTP